jgi:hypothetical protein
MNEEQLHSAAMDMDMHPDDVMAMIGSAERNDSAGVDDDLSLLAMFSSAEHALAQAAGRASGSTAPVTRHCWGCEGHARWGCEPDHLWRNCPRRQDPEVAAIARKTMAAWFSNRKARGSSSYAQRGIGAQAFMGTNSDTAGAISVRTHAMATNWEAEGLPSYEAASILGKIIDPSTGPADRSSLFAALSQVSPSEAASSLTSQSTGPPRVAFAGVATSGAKRVRTGAAKLYNVLITTFQRGEDWTTYAFNGAVQ